ALNPAFRVGDQIGEVIREHTTLRGNAVDERVQELLAGVNLPDPAGVAQRYPHELSGGQQQRVMIAIALACDPDILIADEPTTALDVTIQEQVLDLIRGLTRSRQLAVLLITHDMGVVRNTADDVGVMYRGEIIERASVETFFRNPKEEYSRQLINALPDLTIYREAEEKDELLSLDNVQVHFPIRRGVLQRVVDYTRAVDGVSLSIGRGQTYVLVGESGSGKTTLGRAVLNLEPATAGTIHFDGAAIHALPRSAMLPYRKRIQVIFQNPNSSMNPRLTIAAIIAEGMKSLGLEVDDYDARVTELLERVQLDPAMSARFPHELSGGQLQRVAIARALAVEPELIVCDEPTSALDVSIRAGVLELLQNLQRDSGVSYLFITHDLSIVPGLAHRVGVMQAGKLVEQGTALDILTRPQHPYTQALLAAVPRLDGA
ncbi:MAG: ABC transporter ATP-binding protein, partial [Halioglobus sp.]|nr:ABC transporter ATP-binding protein [Halioglobus sp.]